LARAIRSNNRLDLIVLTTCVVLALAARVLPNTMRDPIATGMRRTFLAPLVMLQERAERGRQSLLMADTRQAAIDSLALKTMNDSSLEGENDRLRKVIGLGSRLRWGFIPTEALHGRGVRDETTVILSAGSHAGVSRLSPVIAPEGLVGVVDQVDPTMSHAMLWTHPDFRVSAMSPDGSAFGIAQAHLTGSATGGYLIELRGVPFRATLKPGAVIVSSGWGGVWQNVAQVDQATQRILVSGDSAAKAAALAEAAARRAVLDSIARANGGTPLGVTDSANAVRTIAPKPAPVRRPTPVDTAAARARRDSVARDSIKRDSVRRDTISHNPGAAR
jgi:rod shape-determining protein MreC